MVWTEGKYEGDVNEFEKYSTAIPWGRVCSLSKYGIEASAMEVDNHYIWYDKLNKVNMKAYDRVMVFTLRVKNEYIPEDVLTEAFNNTVNFSDITKYERDTCCKRITKEKSRNGTIIFCWTDKDHNPEWTNYQFLSKELYRMAIRLLERYDEVYQEDNREDEDEDEDEDEEE